MLKPYHRKLCSVTEWANVTIFARIKRQGGGGGRGVPSVDHRSRRCLVTPGNIYLYQKNHILMYFNIVKFGINVSVTILLVPLSLMSKNYVRASKQLVVYEISNTILIRLRLKNILAPLTFLQCFKSKLWNKPAFIIIVWASMIHNQHNFHTVIRRTFFSTEICFI